MSVRRRRYALAGLLGAVALLTAYLLSSVLSTVFFAVSIAYVLYPLRQMLVDRGASVRLAATLATLSAFATGALLATPPVWVLYVRRESLFAFLREFPATLTLSAAGLEYTVEIASLVENSRGVLEGLAGEFARALPAIALKIFVFALVVYALLSAPGAVRVALLRPVPPAYHDVVLAFHERTKSILYAIYVLQAAVAFGTFLIALVVFWVLGYEAVFTLAVLSGLLQFIPIVGPSVVVLALAALDLAAGNVVDAAIVTVVGFVVVGFLPDAIIRPRLARLTTGIPGSLYFVGFTGGVLSVGLVGFVAGPVVVALLAEAVSLLSAETDSRQQQLT
jgi:predicted PurR-regulated permease PerM